MNYEKVSLPRGKKVDFQACAVPENAPLEGSFSRVEPVDATRHVKELYEAANLPGSDRVWAYLPYGPFPNIEEMQRRLEFCQQSIDPKFYVFKSRDLGVSSGMGSFMRMEPTMGVIEIGHLWMSPLLQKTRAATESLFLMMDLALGDLGYRRLEWKCDALNAGSRAAALRLGFSYEGTFRQHSIVKGRNRDTAWFSLLDNEWLEQKRRFKEWLLPSNFTSEARQVRSLAQCGR